MEENKSKIAVKIDLPSLKVELITEVPFAKVDETLDKFLESISKANKKISKLIESEVLQPKITFPPTTSTVIPILSEDPLSLIANRLETDLTTLKDSHVLGIKDDKVQILKPQKFSVAEAILVLAFCYEVGLKRVGERSINYGELKLAYQDSGVKGNTPFKIAINNLKNAGHIDKNRYDSTQEIILKSKGMAKAGKHLKEAISK